MQELKIQFNNSFVMHEIAEHLEERGVATQYEDEPGIQELHFETQQDLKQGVDFCVNEYGCKIGNDISVTGI